MADIGHGDGAVFLDGFLMRLNWRRKAGQGHNDGVADVKTGEPPLQYSL